MRVRAVLVMAGIWAVGAGCGSEANDAANVGPDSSASTPSSTSGSGSTLSSTAMSELSGGVDGPVMFAPGPSTEGGEDALIEGVLSRDGDCLFVGDAAPGSRFAVLWPFGTTWDDAAQAVVTSSGEAIPVGSIVSAGGGYPDAENVRQMSVTDELSERVGRCAEGEFSELAHVQHSITVEDAAAETDEAPPAPSQGWVRAPEPPIEARSSAVVADLDGTIIVTGGWEYLCPPGADCAVDPASVTRFADGAAFDPRTGEWVPIADAPLAFVRGGWTTSGTDLYVAAGCVGDTNCAESAVVLRYRGTDDEWDTLSAPDQLPAPSLTTLADGTVVAFGGSDERGESPDYLLVGDRWEPLPDDPLPAVYDRFALGDGERLFVFGSPIDGEDRSKLGAVFDRNAGSWTTLATAPDAGYQVWSGDDGFYLNPHFGPSVRGGLYDPNLDTWSGFPEPPESDTWRNDLAGVLRAEDATYEYSSGWVRDTSTDQWIEIPERPSPTGEGESLTNSGRRLVVYGGQDWTGGEGRLLNDVWTWTPPSADD